MLDEVHGVEIDRVLGHGRGGGAGMLLRVLRMLLLSVVRMLLAVVAVVSASASAT